MALTCSIKDLSFSKAFPTVVMVETETTMAGHKGLRDSVCFEGEDVGAKVGEQDLGGDCGLLYCDGTLQLETRPIVYIATVTGGFISKFKL